MRSTAPTHRFALFVLLGDAVVLYLTFLLAYWTRVHLPFSFLLPVLPVRDYHAAALSLIALSLMVFVFYGLYDMRRRLSLIEDYIKLVKSITLALVIALTMTFFFKYYERSRTLAVVFWLLALCSMILYRWAVGQYLKHKRRKGWDTLNVVILGVDRKGLDVEKIFRHFPELGYRSVGSLLLDPARDLASKKNPTPVPDALAEKIAKWMVKQRVDGLILTLPIRYYEQMVGIVDWCENKGLEVHYITSVMDVYSAKAVQDELQENILLEVAQTSNFFWRDLAKRLMDEVVAGTVLLLTLPLWLAVALAIKLDSPGPVLFKQERVGRGGRHFTIYKFRTMLTTAPKYGVTPRKKGDPRVTRVGALLRQTSLDELPQLLNVIKGDMSLVGPRPEQPFIVEKYLSPIYHRRHLVLPGLTGLWQVSGRSDKPLEENIKYDLYYIKHRSLLFDLLILLRTIPAVISKKGAY